MTTGETEIRKRQTGTAKDGGPDAAEIQRQKEKRSKWMQNEDAELKELRESATAKSEKDSNLALKIVVLVWLVIILGIFYHVYNTIQAGQTSKIGGL